MSKISFKPADTGTATFTIEAPATNTNRTLTLPDEAGTILNDTSTIDSNNLQSDVYRQSNILGTVSESSGVPTGAVIERGSNANGEYVKFADGTLICQQVFTGVDIDQTSDVTNLRFGNVSWNFPVSFQNLGNVFGHRQGAGGMGVGVFFNNNASASVRFWDNHDSARSNQICRATAIGRWY